jgi:hypothetical protein|tara:strand:+ start:295 stop:420 length:126 start_codon:yes stop_codon:yes gene_type:complete
MDASEILILLIIALTVGLLGLAHGEDGTKSTRDFTEPLSAF